MPLVVAIVVVVVEVTLVKDATDALLCEGDECVWLLTGVDVEDVSAGMAMVECVVAPEAMDTCGLVAIVFLFSVRPWRFGHYHCLQCPDAGKCVSVA